MLIDLATIGMEWIAKVLVLLSLKYDSCFFGVSDILRPWKWVLGVPSETRVEMAIL